VAATSVLRIRYGRGQLGHLLAASGGRFDPLLEKTITG